MKIKHIKCLLVVMSISWAGLSEGDKGVILYSPLGKRDPFQVPKLNPRELASPSDDILKYSLEQFQLRAILKSPRGTQILVEDPKGKSHILQEGEMIGRGRATISRVLDREVIFTERVTNYLGVQNLTEKTLSLPPDEEGTN